MSATVKQSARRKTRAPKCECGCDQAPAATTRLRKAECPSCGYSVRLTREWIAKGLPACPCGETLTVACLFDRTLVPGCEDAAWSELDGRRIEREQRSEYAKRAARRRRRCKSEHGCPKWTAAGELYCPEHAGEGMPF